MRKAHALWILAGLAACGEGATDADAWYAIDAADGMVPDAVQCSVTPAPVVPAPTWAELDVVFDVPLAAEPYPQLRGVHASSDGVVVFTEHQIHRVALDGTSVGTQAMPPDGRILRTIAGDGTFGAIAQLDPRWQGEAFCVLDAAGTFDPLRCTVTWGLASIAFDGASYLAYMFLKTHVRRTYDQNASQIAEQPITADGYIQGALATASREDLFWFTSPRDASCPTLHHQTTTVEGAQIRGAVPEDTGPGYEPLAIAAGGSGHSFVVRASCRFPDGCESVPETTSLLTTLDGETVVADRVAVPLLAVYPLVLLRDGDHTVALQHDGFCEYEDRHNFRCSAWGVATRFGLDGSVELPPAVVTPVVDGSISLGGAVLGAGDYAIAYVEEGDIRMLRLRRIRTPRK